MKRMQVGIIGAGFAGLSAAVYLGRAQRRTFIVDEGKSMGRWEPRVQNYLGFPKGIAGTELLKQGSLQARRYGTRISRDRINAVLRDSEGFVLEGRRTNYRCDKLLLATGIFHIPPDIPGVAPCLGHSMFFCKDCDGYRVHGKPVAIYGWTEEAVDYALAMLLFSPCVVIVTDGHAPAWGRQCDRWIEEYRLPVHTSRIIHVRRRGSLLRSLELEDGKEIGVRVLFTTRGDIYFNELAEQLGAELDDSGAIKVDLDGKTSVPGLFSAGCVTPANCQMIIAAGQGATAAQAINRELHDEALASHHLRRYRRTQLNRHRVHPQVKHRQSPNTISPLHLRGKNPIKQMSPQAYSAGRQDSSMKH